MSDAPKKARAKQKIRPIFVILQILDENGNAVNIPKEQINLIAVTRDTGIALDVMEGTEFPFATYKKADTVT